MSGGGFGYLGLQISVACRGARGGGGLEILGFKYPASKPLLRIANITLLNRALTWYGKF